MNSTVILIGLVVGAANYGFRYIPLRFSRMPRQTNATGNWVTRIVDGIGIASICSLLVVSSVPSVMHDSDKLLPTLVGFAVLTICYYQSRSIVLATLAGALSFGLVYKFFVITIFT
ncbi:L-valine transporter subunit YgaH [Acerihabitans sp. TG2]|uniref:L-valine transporter subunit YgaH n=1 Tax=Acerihabitans sp. TG2 TaxID=3096008 RepID=UPI002B2277A6|nr:L-valine transporter subunit YgaH [Acerihabitans sp. TG2]MEA9391427.1 L-valine transporter subunit YgaH [Acerihabitans sp. TG2]